MKILNSLFLLVLCSGGFLGAMSWVDVALSDHDRDTAAWHASLEDHEIDAEGFDAIADTHPLKRKHKLHETLQAALFTPEIAATLERLLCLYAGNDYGTLALAIMSYRGIIRDADEILSDLCMYERDPNLQGSLHMAHQETFRLAWHEKPDIQQLHHNFAQEERDFRALCREAKSMLYGEPPLP